MTTEESMQDEHLALAFECNRQLRMENEALKVAAERKLKECNEFWGRKHDADYTEIQRLHAQIAAMQPIPCTEQSPHESWCACCKCRGIDPNEKPMQATACTTAAESKP